MRAFQVALERWVLYLLLAAASVRMARSMLEGAAGWAISGGTKIAADLISHVGLAFALSASQYLVVAALSFEGLGLVHRFATRPTQRKEWWTAASDVVTLVALLALWPPLFVVACLLGGAHLAMEFGGVSTVQEILEPEFVRGLAWPLALVVMVAAELAAAGIGVRQARRQIAQEDAERLEGELDRIRLERNAALDAAIPEEPKEYPCKHCNRVFESRPGRNSHQGKCKKKCKKKAEESGPAEVGTQVDQGGTEVGTKVDHGATSDQPRSTEVGSEIDHGKRSVDHGDTKLFRKCFSGEALIRDAVPFAWAELKTEVGSEVDHGKRSVDHGDTAPERRAA